MRKFGIVVKVWLAVTLLILVVMVPLEMGLSELLTEFYDRQVTDPMLYHSRQLAEMLVLDQRTASGAAVMGQMVGGEVIILDGSGSRLIFPGSSSLKLPAPAVRAAMAGLTVTEWGELAPGQRYVVTGVPIPGKNGAVFLLTRAEPLEQSLLKARRYLWLAGGGTLLLGTLLALILSRQLVRPVVAMAQATRSIARGDFSTRVKVTSTDEIGHLARSVNQMTAQLEGYENRRREFLANVAHELRTPLSYIRGYTQAMADGLVTREEDRLKVQAIIQEEAVRLSQLVDDLMDLAQMEEGQMHFTMAPVDIKQRVAKSLATVGPRAAEKSITLVDALPEHLPELHADESRLAQVLFNLLDNALRHTPSGGQITVSAETEEGWITVRVADTGLGIDPAMLPLIFERFHKHHSTGRGLGLAVVRSIIRAHGGEVGAESEPGKGSCFWFRLPTARESASEI